MSGLLLIPAALEPYVPCFRDAVVRRHTKGLHWVVIESPLIEPCPCDDAGPCKLARTLNDLYRALAG
jgi:hypothetical protein